MTNVPPAEWLVSVDDHIIEPPRVWLDRLPSKYHDRAPRMDAGGNGAVWRYEDKIVPTSGLSVAAGKQKEQFSPDPVSFDDMRPGAYDPSARVKDMDRAGILASVNFPSFPRFCGQIFWEAKDKDLALLCVQAYNDWMVDEWCGPEAKGRLIPLTLIPLWDAELAAAEVRRNAARGVRAVCFSEIPPFLGLPSVHDPDHYWDPFFRACAETGTIVNMHIGSSSKMPSTSADAPPAVGSTLTHSNATYSMVDFMFSGVLVRFPDLKLAYAEGQIGWIPYILERADNVWEENRGWGGVADIVPEPPSTYFHRQIYGCFFDDAFGLKNVDSIGVDNITYESDYPHSDSTWPQTRQIAEKQMKDLTDEQIYKIVRGNAIKLYDLDFK
jgi:predicted TIM-barrel fold metal-dependent hydrolase